MTKVNDSVGIDVGGIWRNCSNNVSQSLANYCFSDDGNLIAYFQPCDEPSSTFFIPNINLNHPNAKDFYITFGKYLCVVMLHNGQFPIWLHPGIIKYITGEAFSFAEDIVPHFQAARQYAIVGTAQALPPDTVDFVEIRTAFLRVCAMFEFSASNRLMAASSSVELYKTYEPLLALEYFVSQCGVWSLNRISH